MEHQAILSRCARSISSVQHCPCSSPCRRLFLLVRSSLWLCLSITCRNVRKRAWQNQSSMNLPPTIWPSKISPAIQLKCVGQQRWDLLRQVIILDLCVINGVNFSERDKSEGVLCSGNYACWLPRNYVVSSWLLHIQFTKNKMGKCNLKSLNGTTSIYEENQDDWWPTDAKPKLRGERYRT